MEPSTPIIYDDRERFPWILMYGDGYIWGKYRTRTGALKMQNKLEWFLNRTLVKG